MKIILLNCFSFLVSSLLISCGKKNNDIDFDFSTLKNQKRLIKK